MKLTFTFFLLLIFFNSTAQKTWITMLPDQGSAKKMIKSDNNNYLVVSSHNDNGFLKIGLTKITNTGQILWQKIYGPPDDEIGHIYYIDILQTTDNKFFIMGKFNSRPIIISLDDAGDIIWYKTYPEFTVDSQFSDMIEKSPIEYWTVLNGFGITPKIHRMSILGEMTFADTCYNLPYGIIGKITKISNDTLMIIAYQSTNETHFYYFNFDSNTQIAHRAYNIRPNLYMRLGNGSHLIHENTNYNPETGAYNGKGMVCLSSGLDSLFKVEFTQYYNYGGVMGCPLDMNACANKGLALCGTMYWAGIYYPYLIVLDSTYHSSILKVYPEIIPDRSVNVFQEPDGGYVMLQGNITHDAPANIYVVKVDAQGNFSSIERKYGPKPNIKLNIFPNPSSGEVRIKISEKIWGKISFHDLNGNVCLEHNLEYMDEIILNLSNLPVGMYIISLWSIENKMVAMEQFLKK